jgi:hypothetical protein
MPFIRYIIWLVWKEDRYSNYSCRPSAGFGLVGSASKPVQLSIIPFQLRLLIFTGRLIKRLNLGKLEGVESRFPNRAQPYLHSHVVTGWSKRPT